MGRRSTSTRTRKTKTKSKYIPQGDTQGARIVKTRRKRKAKRKPSLASKVAKIAKRLGRLPPPSVKHHTYTVPMILRHVQINSGRLYFIKCFTALDIESMIDVIPTIHGDVDMTASNSALKIGPTWWCIELKNFHNTASKVKYQFLRCNDDDAESYLKNVLESAEDRGQAIAGTESAAVAASATSASVRS